MGTTNKPVWVTGEYGTSYGEIVDGWGYEVLDFQTCGSYQGDHVVLLKDGKRYGYVVIGYGSCSGCDALAAAEPWYNDENADWTDVQKIADETRESIHWFLTPSFLVEYLQQRDTANEWYWHDSEIKAVMEKWVAMLQLGD